MDVDGLYVQDQSLHTYAWLARPESDPPVLPLSVDQGRSVEVSLVFEIPIGGHHTLRATLNGAERSAEIVIVLDVITAAASPSPTHRIEPTIQPADTGQQPVGPSTTAPDGGGGTRRSGDPAGSDWNQATRDTATAWLRSVESTYFVVSDNTITLRFYRCCSPGATPAERAAVEEEVAIYVGAAQAAIQTHLALMNSRPPAACFADGYAADQTVAAAYFDWLSQWQAVGGDSTPQGRYQNQVLDDLDAGRDQFFRGIDGYFDDCG